MEQSELALSRDFSVLTHFSHCSQRCVVHLNGSTLHFKMGNTASSGGMGGVGRECGWVGGWMCVHVCCMETGVGELLLETEI